MDRVYKEERNIHYLHARKPQTNQQNPLRQSNQEASFPNMPQPTFPSCSRDHLPGVQMDRVYKDEHSYILGMQESPKQINKNVASLKTQSITPIFQPCSRDNFRTVQMDRVYKEERNYILGMVKKIKASGCNVLLIQKSILRDAVTDLSLHYLVSRCL
jgi:hypothetical protein